MARSSSRSPELPLAAVVEAEQLVGVAMLLVIVDETGIRRRGEDTRKAPLQPNVPRVAVQDLCVARTISHKLELSQAVESVEEIAGEELLGFLNRAACASMLVTPVGLSLRSLRELEVEVRGQPRRAGSSRQDDTKDVRVLVLLEEGPEVQQLGSGARRSAA